MENPDYAQAKQTSETEIPVIDLSNIGTEEGFNNIAKEIVATAQDYGFFYVANHGVSPGLRKAAFAASKRFFDLPEDAKSTVTVDQNQRGWMAQGMTRLEGSKTHDAKEVFFWGFETAKDDPDFLNDIPLVAPNQWPIDAAPWLFEAIDPYYKAVINLSQTLLSLIGQGLGQSPEFFEQHYKKPLARGQLVYYPPTGEGDVQAERMGAAAHTDFGALTILAQDDLGGLQVQHRTAGWIEAPPIEDCFVCNIGDLLQLWTGGKLRSTVHRVINRASVPRYSIPVFCDPESIARIDPADFGQPSTTDIITAGEHIAGRNKKNFAQYKKD